MAIRGRVGGGLRALLRRQQVEQDLDDELRQYFEAAVERQLAAGLGPADARRAARRELGSIAAVKDHVRGSGWESIVDGLWRDVRYAVRTLARAPGFASIVVLVFALGISLNAVMFAVVDAALFKPLPYRDPDQLVDILRVERRGTGEQSSTSGMTRGQIADWRLQSQVFAGIESIGSSRRLSSPEAASADGLAVGPISPGLLGLLGVAPALGRGFGPADATPDGEGVALISHSLWRRAFGASPAVLGRTLTLGDRQYSIIGVLPASVRSLFDGVADVWIPLPNRRTPDDATPYVGIVARLRAGLSLEDARREAALAAAALQSVRPEPQPWDVDLVPIDGHRSSSASRALLVLLGAIGLVLAIACANVANLLLSRGLTREREMAIRGSLGASRARLVAQLVTEGIVLAACGGLVAWLLSWWSVSAIPRLIPPRMGFLFGVHLPVIDGRLMLFMLGIACATGVLTSLVPALRVSNTKPGVALGSAGRAVGVTRGHRRVASALQGAQIALTIVLLTASGLLTSSFVRMMWADPGFDSENLGYANVSLPVAAYPTGPQQEEMFDDLLARVRSIPGVAAATVGTPPPGGWGSGSFVVEAVEGDRGSSRRSADIYNVSPDYFGVSGVRLRYGRVFGPDDSPTAPPAAIIDAATAERVWPGESALGRRFRYSPYVPWLTIVGVVEPVSTTKFSADSVQVYLPRSQQSSGAYGTLLFRTSREVTALLPAIRAEVQRSDSRIGVESAAPVAALYGDALKPRRVVLVLMDLFAAMALTIAGVGLYGLLSYSVSRRSQEFGVRIALGADAWNVRRLAVAEAMWPVAGGLIVGLLLTVALSRLARGFVSDISPYDPVTFAIVAVLLLLVAICAAYLPAQRAARADPIVALRAE